MTLVDQNFATWLASEEALALAEDAAIAGKWGSIGVDARISSPIAVASDAEAEATRQLAFLAGPKAIETVRVPGEQAGLIGRVVTIHAEMGGYAGGVDVFVLAADESDGDGGTKLTVLRRL